MTARPIDGRWRVTEPDLLLVREPDAVRERSDEAPAQQARPSDEDVDRSAER